MTNIEIVQMLANGYKTHEIAKEFGTTRLYVAKKINEIRDRCLCKTYGQLIAVYFRKKLIE
jgi:DNA-binding NarL/FixJ family response regulator